MITWAVQAAPKPHVADAAPLIRDSPAAPNPRNVAGPTNGPARMLASNPDRLTWPEIPATTGSVARCAASGTVTDSATTRGSQRSRIPDQLRAHHRMAPLASTDSTNPTDRLRKGSSSSSASIATARLRTPARLAPDPKAARATRPIAAARSTLGSVRHRATNAITPQSPVSRSPQPRTPSHRLTVNTNASNKGRFAPDTAVKWIRPVTANSSS